MKAYREWDKITKNGSWEVSGFETFRATEAWRVTRNAGITEYKEGVSRREWWTLINNLRIQVNIEVMRSQSNVMNGAIMKWRILEFKKMGPISLLKRNELFFIEDQYQISAPCWPLKMVREKLCWLEMELQMHKKNILQKS